MTENAAPEVTTISLAEICAELGIKPQNARVKLRRKMKAEKGEGFRWVFPIDQKDEIVSLLKSSAPAAPAAPAATVAGATESEDDDGATESEDDDGATESEDDDE